MPTIPRAEQPVPWTYSFGPNGIQLSTIDSFLRWLDAPDVGFVSSGVVNIDDNGYLFIGERFFNIPFIVTGGATGLRGSFPNIAFAFEILGWTLESPTAGNVELDLVADPYADNSFPSTIINAAAPPQMTGVKSAHSTTLTGWITTIPPDYSLGFDLVDCTVDQFTISLTARRLS